MNKLVEKLVRSGIEVTIKLDSNGNVRYDLNSRTKSGMYLYEDVDGTFYVTGRYNEHEVVETLEDLVHVFASRYIAKGFGSDEWLWQAVALGVMKENHTVAVTYEYR